MNDLLVYQFSNGWSFSRYKDGTVMVYFKFVGGCIDATFSKKEWDAMEMRLALPLTKKHTDPNASDDEGLTATNRAVLGWIRDYLVRARYRTGPSISEIAAGLNLTRNTVAEQVHKLRKYGYIRYFENRTTRRIFKVRLPGEPPL